MSIDLHRINDKTSFYTNHIYRGIEENTGEYRGIQENIREYREKQGNTGESKKTQGDRYILFNRRFVV